MPKACYFETMEPTGTVLIGSSFYFETMEPTGTVLIGSSFYFETMEPRGMVRPNGPEERKSQRELFTPDAIS